MVRLAYQKKIWAHLSFANFMVKTTILFGQTYTIYNERRYDDTVVGDSDSDATLPTRVRNTKFSTLVFSFIAKYAACSRQI